MVTEHLTLPATGHKSARESRRPGTKARMNPAERAQNSPNPWLIPSCPC